MDDSSVHEVQVSRPAPNVSMLLRQMRPNASLAVSKLRSIAGSNSSLAIIDQSVVSGTRFLTSILIGRVCGREELGIYALVFTLFLVFICVQESMVTTPYVVFMNRLKGRRRRTFAGSVLSLCFVVGFASMLIVFGGTLMLWTTLGPTQWMPTSLMMAAMLPFILLWHLARSFSIAHLQLGRTLLLDIMTSALQIGLIACLIWNEAFSSSAGYLAIGAGCAVTGIAWLLVFWKKFRIRQDQLLADWRRSYSFGRWVLAGQVMGTIQGYLPIWVLAVALGTAATGVFSACESIVLISNPVILAIANLYGATTARAFAQGGYLAVRQNVRKALWYCSAAMLLLCLLAFGLGDMLVTLLYGGEFSGNGLMIGTISLAAPFWAVGAILGVALRSVDRPKFDFQASLLGAVVTLLGSALTVSFGGVMAVAISLVLGSATLTLYLAWAFYRRVPAESGAITSY